MKIIDAYYPTVTHKPDRDTIVTLELRENEVFSIRRGKGLVDGSTRARYEGAWQSFNLPPRYKIFYNDLKRFLEKERPELFEDNCNRENCVLCRKHQVNNVPEPLFLRQ